MMRKCDGTDPNLLRDGQPCDCGLAFDDVTRMVIYPHNLVHGGRTPEQLAEHIEQLDRMFPGWPA
jgi:hypothetical protein